MKCDIKVEIKGENSESISLDFDVSLGDIPEEIIFEYVDELLKINFSYYLKDEKDITKTYENVNVVYGTLSGRIYSVIVKDPSKSKISEIVSGIKSALKFIKEDVKKNSQTRRNEKNVEFGKNIIKKTMKGSYEFFKTPIPPSALPTHQETLS